LSEILRSRLSGPIVILAITATAPAAQQRPTPRPAVPVDAITAIVDAFASHDVVALGEGPHGNQQGHSFRLSLLRDPRFATTVNDILVEFGNGRYQALMDRFVDGADVARDELRHVWQDTTTPTRGGSGQYTRNSFAPFDR
jgi:erythromycin esterase-like protein